MSTLPASRAEELLRGATDLAAPARWPVERLPVVTSKFGWRKDPLGDAGLKHHDGMDLRGAVGEVVRTPWAGVVVKVWATDGAGLQIRVQHLAVPAVITGYSHLNAASVEPGDVLEAGRGFAEVGKSGKWVTGPHLHFCLEINGRPYDPEPVLDNGWSLETLAKALNLLRL